MEGFHFTFMSGVFFHPRFIRMLRLTRLVRLVRTLRFEIFYELKMMVLGAEASAAQKALSRTSDSKLAQVASGMRVLIWAMVLLVAT